MLLLIVSFIIFLVISLQINQYFSYRKWFDWFLGAFLILISLIILVMTAAGLFYQMNQPLFVLVFQVIILSITTAVSRYWLKPEQPLIPFPFPKFNLKEMNITFPVWIFLISNAAVAILNLVYVLLVPPNNNDSLTIHLARIGMWDQSGSWLPWNTKVVWQLTFPMNAELISYWTLLFTRSEHLLGLIAYLSGYLSVFLIYHLGLEISNRKSLALLSALTWAAFPVVQMNFSSTRHDHVSSFMLIAAVYFFYHHLKEKNTGYLILSGLGLGLSIGTNYSVAGYLPGLALFFLIFWLVFRKINFREVIILAASASLAFILFSSPVYISNYVHFGSFLGPDALEMTSQNALQEDASPIEHTGLMAGRWAYQIVDFQGIPEPYLTKLMELKAVVPNYLGTRTGLSLEVDKSLLNQHTFGYSDHIPFSEDSSWFGLVGIFIFFILSIYGLVVTIRHKQPLMVLTSLFLLTAPLAFAFLRSGWTPYDGRYFMILFAFLCLGMTVLLDALKPKLGLVLIYFISTLSILTLLMSVYGNPAKAFWGYKAFWKQHRFDSISAQSYTTKEMLYVVDQTVPEDGVLGIATPAIVYYEYGLFGEHFTRTIIPIYLDDRVCDHTWLLGQGIEFILVDASNPDYPACSLGEYEYQKSMKDWIVFKIN
ncbi:MAG: hypothetical protein CVU41_17525 [Chloroflexi bacterium HGW-Chloroflexi-3]|nr:MAG: hypothetical protein CVU41_17525 [Chloroflexi bacterium HGW-Chloroflexi-3]